MKSLSEAFAGFSTAIAGATGLSLSSPVGILLLLASALAAGAFISSKIVEAEREARV